LTTQKLSLNNSNINNIIISNNIIIIINNNISIINNNNIKIINNINNNINININSNINNIIISYNTTTNNNNHHNHNNSNNNHHNQYNSNNNIIDHNMKRKMPTMLTPPDHPQPTNQTFYPRQTNKNQQLLKIRTPLGMILRSSPTIRSPPNLTRVRRPFVNPTTGGRGHCSCCRPSTSWTGGTGERTAVTYTLC